MTQVSFFFYSPSIPSHPPRPDDDGSSPVHPYLLTLGSSSLGIECWRISSLLSSGPPQLGVFRREWSTWISSEGAINQQLPGAHEENVHQFRSWSANTGRWRQFSSLWTALFFVFSPSSIAARKIVNWCHQRRQCEWTGPRRCVCVGDWVIWMILICIWVLCVDSEIYLICVLYYIYFDALWPVDVFWNDMLIWLF